MGALTLEDLITEVQIGMGGIRDDDQTATDDPTGRIARWVNAGYRYVCQPNIMRHPELLTTINVGVLVTDTETYTIPTASFDFYALADGRLFETPADPASRVEPLDRLTLRQWREMRPNYSQGSLPEWYTCIATNAGLRQVMLLARPSAQYAGWTLQTDLWREPVTLTAGLTTVLRADWDDVIIQAGVWWGLRSMKRYVEAEPAKQDLDALVNNQIDVFKHEAEDMIDGVGFVDFEPYMEMM